MPAKTTSIATDRATAPGKSPNVFINGYAQLCECHSELIDVVAGVRGRLSEDEREVAASVAYECLGIVRIIMQQLDLTDINVLAAQPGAVVNALHMLGMRGRNHG